MTMEKCKPSGTNLEPSHQVDEIVVAASPIEPNFLTSDGHKNGGPLPIAPHLSETRSEKSQDDGSAPGVLAQLESADEQDYPDGGLNAWMVVIASFVGHFFVFGMMYSFGVYQTYYLDLGVGSASSVAFIGSTGSVFIPGLGIFAGKMAEVYGFRQVVFAGSVILSVGIFSASFAMNSLPGLICTQGALFGIGSSFVFIPCVSIVAQWFEKRRGLATGIAVSGAGFGGLVMSLATDAMLKSIGLAWTLRATGIASLVCLVTVTPFLKTRLPPSAKSTMDLAILKDGRFTSLLLCGFFSTFSMFVAVDFLPLFASIRVNLDLSSGATLLSLYNGGSTAGRILMGFGADKALGATNAMMLAMWVSCISNFSWVAIRSFPGLCVFAIVNGFVGGAFWGLLPTVAAGMFGTDSRLVNILGMLYTSLAFGDFGSPPLTGFIKERFGLDAMVLYGGGVALAGAIAGTVARFLQERKLWKKV